MKMTMAMTMIMMVVMMMVIMMIKIVMNAIVVAMMAMTKMATFFPIHPAVGPINLLCTTTSQRSQAATADVNHLRYRERVTPVIII